MFVFDCLVFIWFVAFFKLFVSLLARNSGRLNRVRLLQPQEQRCPLPAVWAVFPCVQTINAIPLFAIFKIHSDVDAFDSTRGLREHQESLHWKLTGRNIHCSTGESNPCQYWAWLFGPKLHQLNYPAPIAWPLVPAMQPGPECFQLWSVSLSVKLNDPLASIVSKSPFSGQSWQQGVRGGTHYESRTLQPRKGRVQPFHRSYRGYRSRSSLHNFPFDKTTFLHLLVWAVRLAHLPTENNTRSFLRGDGWLGEAESERSRERERELYFSTVKILSQRPTHISIVATVLLITKRERESPLPLHE